MHIFRFYLIFCFCMCYWIEQCILFMQQYTFISDLSSIPASLTRSLYLSISPLQHGLSPLRHTVCLFFHSWYDIPLCRATFILCVYAALLAFFSFFAALYLGQFKMWWFSFCSFVLFTIAFQNMKYNAMAFLCICLDTILIVVALVVNIFVGVVVIIEISILPQCAHSAISFIIISHIDWICEYNFVQNFKIDIKMQLPIKKKRIQCVFNEFNVFWHIQLYFLYMTKMRFNSFFSSKIECEINSRSLPIPNDKKCSIEWWIPYYLELFISSIWSF